MDSPLTTIFRELTNQARPEVLNFQVNDICNARCVMCNIWQNKRGRELSPAEFAELLHQPFFQGVKHVGITGGEPTLRGDLPQFYEALLTTLPNLIGASFITNGFKSPEAIAAYSLVNENFKKTGKHFAGMVSIDGVGEVHDRVRGRPGSFAKATATLFGLRAAGVPVQAACTIVKSNVWNVDELLAWGRKNEIYIRFRVGEFIRRLYNLKREEEIRAFDEAETKHLVSFFHQLLLSYEPEERIRLTYQSILSILSGGERLVTCPYQTSRALNVDSEGLFAICAPRGTPTLLGANPERSTRRLIERFRTRLKSCPNCIHDYHGDLTPRESERREAARVVTETLQTEITTSLPKPRLPRSIRRVLLIGWYGTETAGDIAILGGLIMQYAMRGARDFVVLSLYPTYSRVTLPQLGRELNVQLTVHGYDDPSILTRLEGFDAVSMAGGPLMDIDPTELVRNIFRAARVRGVPCFIDGCGIGPLHQPRFQAVVAEMLELATEIRLRDLASVKAAQGLAPRCNPVVIPDPSITYLDRQKPGSRAPADAPIRCWLRMLTHEYPQATGLTEATDIVAEFLRKVLNWYPDRRLELGAMHWFPVGWDDREFARLLVARLGDSRVTSDIVPRAPREILAQMATAHLNLCMRFHSVIFAHRVGAPFAAIDYTAGGKIASYLTGASLGGLELRYPDLAALSFEQFSARIYPGHNPSSP